MVRLWKFSDRDPDPTELGEIADLIVSGEVVILPTDTIYGLHADAGNARAVERVFALKERDPRRSLVVLASDFDQLHQLGVSSPQDVESRLRKLWPSRLTAVLPIGRTTPASADAKTIAVRIPAVRWLRDLVKITGPIVSTSVNRSGEPPLYTMDSLPDSMRIGVAGIVDSGALQAKGSTVVDFTIDPPEVLREGEFLFTQNLWKSLRKSL